MFLLQNMKNEEMSTIVVMNLVSAFVYHVLFWFFLLKIRVVTMKHFKPPQHRITDLSAVCRRDTRAFRYTETEGGVVGKPPRRRLH